MRCVVQQKCSKRRIIFGRKRGYRCVLIDRGAQVLDKQVLVEIMVEPAVE